MSLAPFRGRYTHCGHDHGNGVFDLGGYKPIHLTKTQLAERVQEYTRRGSPIRGRFRLRTPRERWQEIFAGVVITTAVVLAVLLPALVSFI